MTSGYTGCGTAWYWLWSTMRSTKLTLISMKFNLKIQQILSQTVDKQQTNKNVHFFEDNCIVIRSSKNISAQRVTVTKTKMNCHQNTKKYKIESINKSNIYHIINVIAMCWLCFLHVFHLFIDSWVLSFSNTFRTLKESILKIQQ